MSTWGSYDDEDVGVGSGFAGVTMNFNDMLSGLMVVFMALLLVSIPYINPQARDIADKRAPGPPTPLELTIGWSQGQPADVDMWVHCQSMVDGKWGDPLLISWTRRSDKWLDLQRDDIGNEKVPHFEVVRTNSNGRTIPPNTRCWVNLHLYSRHDATLPVTVYASLIVDRNAPTERLVTPPGSQPVKDDNGQQWSVKVPMAEQAGEVNLFYLFFNAESKLEDYGTYMYPHVKPCALAREKIGADEKRCGVDDDAGS